MRPLLVAFTVQGSAGKTASETNQSKWLLTAFRDKITLIDENNKFVRTDIAVETITQPWHEDFGEFEMMRYIVSDVQTEDEGLINLPPNGQSMFMVINKDHTNRWVKLEAILSFQVSLTLCSHPRPRPSSKERTIR